ncbi:hypothetical protein ETD83_06855 [Actinomadura soli]|uniref:Mce-associated membrane protein n=1 Tax=Actinomadura soli TaxID=2508997 RepID=A0A5C4JGQ8_9ACTN|nr:hypothetical protein [Actinomadura soli]TMR05413.1 hypothetical protein ETD83_06855 [Actinomadura soli]
MTMLGRGKRSDSGKKKPKDKAAEQAAKAEEAAEAARLAEEAAAKAREAARLAKIAADEAAAEADEAEETDEAVKSLQKPQDPPDDSEDASDGDSAPEDGSASPEVASAPVDATESDEAPETDEDAPKPVKVKKTAAPKAAPKPAPKAAPRPGRWFRSGSMGTVVAVLVVLMIAFGAGTTALALEVREQNATVTASKEASFAASRAAQKLSSYDYQTLDADLKAASATTTGKLRTDYDKLAQQLRTVAVQQQAVSTTTVMKVGVVSATPDKVVALVYANRSSATKADKQQRLPEPLRIRMTMVKQDGKWLASELTVIS